jgi:Tripartite tricarboxylate transporter TctB family
VKIKSQKDFWSGLMFVATGLGFAAGATNYSFGTSARPGPGYFPFGLGILLALLGAMVLFKSLTVESEGGDPVGTIGWKPLILIVLGVVAFGLALPRLGMIISLPLLIINIVVLTIGSWAIFIKGLNLVIPLWPSFMTA